MAWRDVDLGAVSAYAIAVEKGYQGTEEEWALDQMQAGVNAGIAKDAAAQAVAAKEVAEETLGALVPRTEEALQEIRNESALLVEVVKDAGAEQEKTILGVGNEQKEALVAQGEIQRGRIIAEGDAQEERVVAAGELRVANVQTAEKTAIEQITTARSTGVKAVEDVAAAKKAEAVAAVEESKNGAVNTVNETGRAVLESIPDDYQENEKKHLLVTDTIPNTTQQYTYNASGTLTAIQHMQDGAAVRTDAFAFGDAEIVETRTLATGEVLTITTNLDTLETTVEYAA